MTLIFNALQHMRRLGSICVTLWVMAMSLVLVACSSLPEGAAIPQLQIQKVSFDNQDKSNPHFVIEYTLNHDSSQALALKELRANIFVKGSQAAAFSQKFDNLMVQPYDLSVHRLEVPVNRMNQSAIDSISNSKLVVLDGSCALQAIFSDNPNEQLFNPTSSYAGLFHYIKSDESDIFKSASIRPNLTPQSSAVPLPRPVKEPQADKTDVAAPSDSPKTPATKATQANHAAQTTNAAQANNSGNAGNVGNTANTSLKSGAPRTGINVQNTNKANAASVTEQNKPISIAPSQGKSIDHNDMSIGGVAPAGTSSTPSSQMPTQSSGGPLSGAGSFGGVVINGSSN